MILNKIIVHELIKNSGEQTTILKTSDTLLPVDENSNDLVRALLKSYQGDKILYGNFDQNPGRYFPEKFRTYQSSDRSDQNFVRFTFDTLGNLETIIRNRILARGGYLLYCDYEINAHNFIAIFFIRDKEGKLLRREANSFSIQKIELLWYENQSVRQKFHNPAQTPATRLYN